MQPYRDRIGLKGAFAAGSVKYLKNKWKSMGVHIVPVKSADYIVVPDGSPVAFNTIPYSDFVFQLLKDSKDSKNVFVVLKDSKQIDMPTAEHLFQKLKRMLDIQRLVTETIQKRFSMYATLYKEKRDAFDGIKTILMQLYTCWKHIHLKCNLEQIDVSVCWHQLFQVWSPETNKLLVSSVLKNIADTRALTRYYSHICSILVSCLSSIEMAKDAYRNAFVGWVYETRRHLITDKPILSVLQDLLVAFCEYNKYEERIEPPKPAELDTCRTFILKEFKERKELKHIKSEKDICEEIKLVIRILEEERGVEIDKEAS